MRTLFLFIFSLFFTFSAVAQEEMRLLEDDIPPHLVKNFSDRFPGALDVSWTTNEAGMYTARFLHGDRPWTALYGPDGFVIETREGIKRKYFPNEVLSAVGDYLGTDFKLVNGYRVTHSRWGGYYDVTVRVNGKLQNLVVRDEGMLVEEPNTTIVETE